MAFKIYACILLISLISNVLITSHGVSYEEKKVHIVYMGDLPKGDFHASTFHSNMLQQVVGSAASESLLYSYKRSFNGFVAKLTKDEAQKLAGMEGVVSVFPSQNKQLHTTRSWDFMGFTQYVPRSILESDVIIGMLDTGIWPESQSFDATGYGPIPDKWKGKCTESSNFTCNNKIIGGRYYLTGRPAGPDDILSPRDSEGHGSHTSSTAAGNFVSKASFLGLGEGDARGGVPAARIAVYKICWSDGCSDADILAAFDDAIADGVDLISLSVGGSIPLNYFEDTIAIGAFHSMKNGILTSNSAGNSGPDPASITNFSPWSLSVAASTIDRKFFTPVVLGNSQVYEGISINTFDPEGKMFPLIYGGDAPNTTAGYSSSESRYCYANSLDETLVAGKIVLCDSADSDGPALAGAAGAIVQDDYYTDVAFTYPLPVTSLTTADGGNVSTYYNSTTDPSASILKSITKTDKSAPSVVTFSSRGPNPITSDILKPDLTAPGVDILAAWSEATSVTGSPIDKRVVPYNIISGTSMSCPHVTGAAAYVKSFHPTWSPSAIKSALMTTAYQMTKQNNIDAEFAYGSGHINPFKATNPGLVYDAGEIDYVKFLCGQGYSAKNLKLVTGDDYTCSETTSAKVWDLNYPSFAMSASNNATVVVLSRVFHRNVTNVGSENSTYNAKVFVNDAGLNVTVTPSVLSFDAVGETKSFVVRVVAQMSSTSNMVTGVLVWDDNVHIVKSPIVAYLFRFGLF